MEHQYALDGRAGGSLRLLARVPALAELEKPDGRTERGPYQGVRLVSEEELRRLEDQECPIERDVDLGLKGVVFVSHDTLGVRATRRARHGHKSPSQRLLSETSCVDGGADEAT